MDDKLEYFQIAHCLNKKYEKELRVKKAHFRGNFNSFSLVSLNKETPMLGWSNLKKPEAGEKAYEGLESGSIKPPRRATREKELQAWIIAYAQRNSWVLPFGGKNKVRFLTSEITWSGTKIVNDILGINKNRDLVVIELKSKRLLKELIGQVNSFCNIIYISKNRDFFKKLVKHLSGVVWSGKVVKMIVWPFHLASPHSNFKKEGITEVCYFEKNVNNGAEIDYDTKGDIRFKEFAECNL